MTKRTQIFVSYSHADSAHLLRLKVHLRPYERKGQIDLWVDTQIKVGQKWRHEIEAALNRAAVVVLLVSADFLASDFVAENELPPLLEAAKAEGVKILPVILKPCAFNSTEEISVFQAINPPSEPLISLNESESEAVWVKLAEAVNESINDFRQKNEHKSDEKIPLFDQLGFALELIQSEIRDPSVLEHYDVYEYQHIDCLEFMPSAKAVLQDVPNQNEILESVRQRLSASGWEGDGEIQIMWFPPFIGAGVEDTWGFAVWFVKQSNNGTAFLASPIGLPFARLLEQQW